jgi:superfamily II DNA/RNA helicase
MENSVSKAIEKAQQFSGYLELKEYQRQTIEAYLSGRDVFVSAQTGYGKCFRVLVGK